jgi:predicted transcriptional regulator
MAPQTQDDGAFQRMRVAICSGNRRHVLLALYTGKKSLSTLREELDADAATVVHSLRELEHYRMVEEDELRDYSLTIFGKLLAEKVIDCHRLADVLTSFEAFWFEHDISGIPDYLFSRIGSLQDSNLITDTREQVLSGIETFIALIEGTDVVYLITPFYSLDFVNRLDVFASKDIDWHLIVTEEVMRRALTDAANPNVKAVPRRRRNPRNQTRSQTLLCFHGG